MEADETTRSRTMFLENVQVLGERDNAHAFCGVHCQELRVAGDEVIDAGAQRGADDGGVGGVAGDLMAGEWFVGRFADVAEGLDRRTFTSARRSARR
jgi:hypothetical protein